MVDRLGESIVLELPQDSRADIPRRGLNERYGMSLSSVKRLLRPQRASHGAPRPTNGPTCVE
jgi:hypothetical protein